MDDPTDPNGKANPHAFSGTFGDASPGDLREIETMPDAELLADFRASDAGSGNPRHDALAAEIDRRHLDV